MSLQFYSQVNEIDNNAIIFEIVLIITSATFGQVHLNADPVNLESQIWWQFYYSTLFFYLGTFFNISVVHYSESFAVIPNPPCYSIMTQLTHNPLEYAIEMNKKMFLDIVI